MEVAGYYVVCMCSGSACENGIRARSRDCEYSSGLYQAGGSTLGLRLGVGRAHLLGGGRRRAPRGAAVGQGERLRVGQLYLQGSGERRAPRGAAMGQGQRLQVG